MSHSIFRNVAVRSTVKNYHPDRILSVISKVFEKLIRLVDHQEKCGLFSDFHYGFRPFLSTAGLLTMLELLWLLTGPELLEL